MGMNWFDRNGFNSRRTTYCVISKNSYEIKDELKEIGCTFNKILGWHTPDDITAELAEISPESFCVEVKFDDVAVELTEDEIKQLLGRGMSKTDVEKMRFGYHAKAADYMEALMEKYFPTRKSVFLSESGYGDAVKVGDRITIDEVEAEKPICFLGRYGRTFIYRFWDDESHLFVWFTSKELEIAAGDKVQLRGTIKSFSEYKNEHQTVLNRCVIKEV